MLPLPVQTYLMILVGLVTQDHQGLGGKLIRPAVSNDNANADGQIECRERLGGLLKFYSRKAA